MSSKGENRPCLRIAAIEGTAGILSTPILAQLPQLFFNQLFSEVAAFQFCPSWRIETKRGNVGNSDSDMKQLTGIP